MTQDRLKEFLRAHDPIGTLTEAREQRLRATILDQAMAMAPVTRQQTAPVTFPLPLGRTAWPLSALFLLILGFFVGQTVPGATSAHEASYLNTSVWNAYMQSAQDNVQKGDE